MKGKMSIPDTTNEHDIRRYVANIAKQHGVSSTKTGTDALADLITRLSDDDVRPNSETEDLIVALRRANVIDGPTMIALLGRHLDEHRPF